MEVFPRGEGSKGGVDGKHAANRCRVTGERGGQSRSNEAMEKQSKWRLEVDVRGRVTIGRGPL